LQATHDWIDLFSEIDASSLAVRVELNMIFATEWKPYAWEVIASRYVVIFQLLGTAAIAVLRTVEATLRFAFFAHAAPPASDR
jgi:hypothetical protein